MAILMSIICVVLLAITGGRHRGTYQFLGRARRRQIGVRRAVGRHASRHPALLPYRESADQSWAASLFGMLLAFGLNLWLVRTFALGSCR